MLGKRDHVQRFHPRLRTMLHRTLWHSGGCVVPGLCRLPVIAEHLGQGTGLGNTAPLADGDDRRELEATPLVDDVPVPADALLDDAAPVGRRMESTSASYWGVCANRHCWLASRRLLASVGHFTEIPACAPHLSLNAAARSERARERARAVDLLARQVVDGSGYPSFCIELERDTCEHGTVRCSLLDDSGFSPPQCGVCANRRCWLASRRLLASSACVKCAQLPRIRRG